MPIKLSGEVLGEFYQGKSGGLTKKVAVELYQCRWCDPNGDKPPVRALSAKELEDHHERTHGWLIADQAQKRHFAKMSKKVLAAHFGKSWKNWRQIFALSRRLNYLLNRQCVFVGQSLRTFEAGLGAVHALRHLLIYNSPDSRPYEKGGYIYFPAGPCNKYIESAFEIKPKEAPKPPEEHLPELWEVLVKLIELTKPYHDQLVDYSPHTCLKEKGRLIIQLGYLQGAIKADVQQINERNGINLETRQKVKAS
ncbi:MAG: hypothetical protein M1150_04015 [Patescibacteria group bacterium]|nr:hypothetical protein [Patescibacteria group bacterium]